MIIDDKIYRVKYEWGCPLAYTTVCCAVEDISLAILLFTLIEHENIKHELVRTADHIIPLLDCTFAQNQTGYQLGV